MAASAELVGMTAREAVRRLSRGEVTPLELIDAAVARIETVEPAVNALPTLCVERARDHARRLMENRSVLQGGARGWLAGLPISIKDLNAVAGVRTTHGSPIFADHVPDKSDIVVDRLESNGGVVLAKSNTPEFGAGGNTFNEVFGATRNPWNTALTCGGSSGGAAVSLATGEVWLAHGSDHGGSLRTPASFCSVVGLRPSPGRVPHGPGAYSFYDMSVNGPMARNVGDLALFLDAMAGQVLGDPLSTPAPATSYAELVASPRAPKRVGFTADFGGVVPVDPEVREICVRAARRFADIGAEVEEACPDFSGAMDAYHVIRAFSFVTSRSPLIEKHRDKFKQEILWNAEQGLKMTAAEFGAAQRTRSAIYQRMVDFFRDYDLLLCPAASVPPFDVEKRWVEEIDGHRFDNYVDWMGAACVVSLTSCPAASIPCGFTADGRPVGLQIVAPMRDEGSLLQAAALFEEACGIAGQLPIDPRPGNAP